MTTEVHLVHRVRLRHMATGEPIGPLAATPKVPLVPGWWLRVRGTDVVVCTRQGAPVPAVTPVLRVSVADPVLATVLGTPVVEVPLTSADITVDVAPVPMTLTVTLAAPTTGTPRTGRAVTVRATSGPSPRPSISLPEVSPGVYQAGPLVWTAAFTPLDLLVGGTLLRRLGVDFTRTGTRVRLVDTT